VGDQHKQPFQLSSPIGPQPGLRGRNAVVVAVTLWIASHFFVTMIARFATWEGSASYNRVADLCRWDCPGYGTVLRSGYDKAAYGENGANNWPYHPLFPMTAYPLARWFKLPDTASLVIASKLELLFAIYAFLLLLSDQISCTTDCLKAGSLVAFNPYLIYAHAGYAEPLYFALISLAFYFAQRRRWLASGAMGGLASATRFVGFLFAVSYAIVWLRDWRARESLFEDNLRRVIGLLLCPIGTVAFMLYLHRRMGDALVQLHSQVAWLKVPGNPLHTLWLCFVGLRWPRVWGIMILAALLLSAYLVKLRKPDLGVFLALSVLIPIAATFGSTPRYIWWQPPFLYAAYWIFRRHTGFWITYIFFSGGVAAFTIVEWWGIHPFVA